MGQALERHPWDDPDHRDEIHQCADKLFAAIACQNKRQMADGLNRLKYLTEVAAVRQMDRVCRAVEHRPVTYQDVINRFRLKGVVSA